MLIQVAPFEHRLMSIHSLISEEKNQENINYSNNKLINNFTAYNHNFVNKKDLPMLSKKYYAFKSVISWHILIHS